MKKFSLRPFQKQYIKRDVANRYPVKSKPTSLYEDKTMLFLLGETFEYSAQDVDSGKRGLFKFKIVKKGSGYRAYVLSFPSLEGRDGSLSVIHMMRDGTRHYVCVVQSIHSIEKMKAVARLWARKYLRYIASGKKYEEV